MLQNYVNVEFFKSVEACRAYHFGMNFKNVYKIIANSTGDLLFLARYAAKQMANLANVTGIAARRIA